MPRSDVYVEVGAKRTFAGAVEWPGWCRSGRSEEAALETLVAYGGRYERAMARAVGGFHPPSHAGDLRVRERLTGNATTDFGAPSVAPSADAGPLDARGLRRQQAILDACWVAFDGAVDDAGGARLTKGPRGGGRSLDAIVRHVVAAEGGYLRHVAARAPAEPTLEAVRDTVREALARAVRDGLPAAGPRGGRIWSVRYFVRRAAWHTLDHAWEIEDRRG